MCRQSLITSVLVVAVAILGGCSDDAGDPACTDCGNEDGGGLDVGLPDVTPDVALPDVASDVVTGACEVPSAPYGTLEGSALEPFTLDQCDGSSYEFYNEAFCDSTLTVISIAAGWCGPCILESQQLTRQITEPYGERGVRVIQVLVQDERYRAPTEAYCSAWVSRFGLTNIELIDPAQLTQIYFPGNALPSTIIVDHNGTIQFRENGASQGLASLRAALDRLLADCTITGADCDG